MRQESRHSLFALVALELLAFRSRSPHNGERVSHFGTTLGESYPIQLLRIYLSVAQRDHGVKS